MYKLPIQKAIDELVGKIIDLYNHCAKLYRRTATLKENNDELTKRVGELENLFDLASGRIAALEESNEKLVEEITKLEIWRELHARLIERTNASLNTIFTSLNLLNEDIDDLYYLTSLSPYIKAALRARRTK